MIYAYCETELFEASPSSVDRKKRKEIEGRENKLPLPCFSYVLAGLQIYDEFMKAIGFFPTFSSFIFLIPYSEIARHPSPGNRRILHK